MRRHPRSLIAAFALWCVGCAAEDPAVTVQAAVAAAPRAAATLEGERGWALVDGRFVVLRGSAWRELLRDPAWEAPRDPAEPGVGAAHTLGVDDPPGDDDTVWQNINAIGIGGGGR